MARLSELHGIGIHGLDLAAATKSYREDIVTPSSSHGVLASA